MSFPTVKNYIGGGFIDGSAESLDVICPLDGSVLSQVGMSTSDDLDQAVSSAANAFSKWSKRTIKERSQVFYNYRSLLQANLEELASQVHQENGKTLNESRAEIHKAIEVTEFACSLPQITVGEVLEVSPGVECRVAHEPLGVVASITPFNFPSMVPHWTIPIAITLGNSFILKPSEQVPLSAGRTAELLSKAGLPDGVFNVVNGDRRVVEAICDHPKILAVTFVGSTAVASQVYTRATGNLKRALAMGGAKNHLIVLPDAEVAQTATNVVESMSGCAGQRCMAAATMISVGECDSIIEAVCEKARNIVVGHDVGAVISAAAKERIEQHITEAEQAGATILVDGRNAVVPEHEGGFYVGPTVIDHVTPEMRIAQEEVFGPVLAIVRARDLDTAIEIENASPYGNAAAVYTRDINSAQSIIRNSNAGMVGVNIGVPVPREPFGFGGWNDSRFGAGDITGKSSIGFWTQSKKITSRWD